MSMFLFTANNLPVNDDNATFEVETDDGFTITVELSAAYSPLYHNNPDWPVRAQSGMEGYDIGGGFRYDLEASLRRAKEHWIGDKMADGPEKDAEAQRLLDERFNLLRRYRNHEWEMLFAEVTVSHQIMGDREICSGIESPIPGYDLELVNTKINDMAAQLHEEAKHIIPVEELIKSLEADITKKQGILAGLKKMQVTGA